MVMQPFFPLSVAEHGEHALEETQARPAVNDKRLSLSTSATMTVTKTPLTVTTNQANERDLTSPFILPESATMQASPRERESMSDDEVKKTRDASVETTKTDNAVGSDSNEQKHDVNRSLKREKSFWNLFRTASHDGAAFVDVHAAGRSGGDETIETVVPAIDVAVQEGDVVNSGERENDDQASGTNDAKEEGTRAPIRRKSSLINFSLWGGGGGNKSSRRNSVASSSVMTTKTSSGSVYSEPSNVDDACSASDAATTTSHARMPSRSATMDVQVALIRSGRQLADDHVRFAHARHLIKVTQNEETLRTIATELEQAFREQLDKVSFLHAQYEALTWQLTDLRDENVHLRKQLGALSEQIVERQAEVDRLTNDASRQREDASQVTLVAIEKKRVSSKSSDAHTTTAIGTPSDARLSKGDTDVAKDERQANAVVACKVVVPTIVLDDAPLSLPSTSTDVLFSAGTMQTSFVPPPQAAT